MEHSYPNFTASTKEASHITPHFLFEDTVVRSIRHIEKKGIDAAGGVWSCADDIAKWVQCLLDSTKIKDTQLLKPETYAALFTPQSMVTPAEFYPTAKLTKTHWTTHGLGWFQEDYRGNMLNFHTGSLDGAVAICGLMKDEHFGIYIFANLDHTELRHALLYKALDLWVYHDNGNDWSTKMYALYKDIRDERKKKEKEFESKRVSSTRTSLELKDYAGTYDNELFGKAWIRLAGDSLILSFRNNINAPLHHWPYNTFRGKFENEWMGNALVNFNLGPEGTVTSVSIDDMIFKKTN